MIRWRTQLGLTLALLSMSGAGCDDGEPAGAPSDMTPSDAEPILMVDAGAPDMTPALDMTAPPDAERLPDMELAADMAPLDAEPTPDAERPDAEPDPDAAPDMMAPDMSPPDAEPDAEPPAQVACDPPLSITPSRGFTLPHRQLTLQGAGGTGQWRFTLTENASGAIVNRLLGAYLSGGEAEVTDIITLTDEGCLGEAVAEVSVVRAMTVAPQRITVTPGDTFTFDVGAGSGMFAFELAFNGAGGVVDQGGVYTAGDGEGLDVVRVLDTGTAEELDVEIEVRADAALTPTPPELVIAVGEAQPLVVEGGSGIFSLEGGEDLFDHQGGLILARQPGRALITLTDRFTQRRATLGLTIVDGLQHALPRGGDQFLGGDVVPAGDLDGDGLADAVVGWPEGDIHASNGGAVFVLLGGAEGATPPAQIFGGDSPNAEMGWQVDVADVTGDGLADLITGAHNADVGLGDNGAVYIYPGLEEGLFAEAPGQVLSGQFGGDRLGRSLQACDFNGDGLMDLAAAAWQAEDRDADPRRNTQGGVYVYLGTPQGLPETPDQIIWGMLPDAESPTGWSNAANLQLGRSMTAGDFDGDTRCDLVVGALNYRAPTSNANNDGAVFLYRGQPPGELTPGGLTALPVRAWAPTGDPGGGSQLGRRMAMGDVNGDGARDLLLGHHLAHDTREGDVGNTGAARLFLGGPLSDEPAEGFELPEGADWSMYGEAANRQAGFYVKLSDLDGDDLDDVLVGGFLRGLPDQIANAGRVGVYYAVEDGLPPALPDRYFAGVEAQERFGQGFAGVGDMDGDEIVDLIVVAGRTNTEGQDVGQMYFVSGAGEGEHTPLGVPGRPAGAQFGRAAAIVGDVNGDGFADLAVGAPLGEVEGQLDQVNQGQVALYYGADAGFQSRPSAILAQFPRHSSYDGLGQGVAAAGDFDGDGVADLWAAAFREDKPNNIPAADFYEPARCAGGRNDSGALYLFSGTRGGAPSPTFIYYGARTNDRLQVIAGDLDVNGDGRADVVVGFPEGDHNGRNNSGGFSVIFGRDRAPEADGRIEVICEPDLLFLGGAPDLQLGRSLVGLGDVDRDGCDDFAVGAYLSDHAGRNNEGAVYVFRGWGADGCPAAPTAFGLESGVANDQAGWALASADADGDGLAELAVGAVNALLDGNRRGAVWWIPGERLRALITAEPRPIASETQPTTWARLLPVGGPGAVIPGLANGARAGSGVALLPAVGDRPGYLAVGSPFGAQGGVEDSGGVRVFPVSREGPAPRPWMVFGGEPHRPNGRVGEWVAAAWLPELRQAFMVVGGFFGQGFGEGVDQGAAYLIPLP